MLCNVLLCRAMLCNVVPCCAMLCNVLLCWSMLWRKFYGHLRNALACFHVDFFLKIESEKLLSHCVDCSQLSIFYFYSIVERTDRIAGELDVSDKGKTWLSSACFAFASLVLSFACVNLVSLVCLVFSNFKKNAVSYVFFLKIKLPGIPVIPKNRDTRNTHKFSEV